MQSGNVLSVVGSVALDTLAHVKALPSPEETGGILRLHVDLPGGTGGNVTMALARLGSPARLLSAVGPDFAGSAYERALMQAGVALDGLARVQTGTSRCYIFFDGTGRQVSYFMAGASASFAPERSPGGRVHFCAGEISRYPALMEGADWVSFDPGQEVFHRDLQQILGCLPLVDVLFVNRHELAHLEKVAETDVPRLLAAGPEAIVETRGPEGTLVHTRSGRFAAPAVPTTVVDPTGAGDAHRAGFLFAMARGADVGVAARFANVMGSFAVEHVGAQTGHPTLEAAIERHEKTYREKPF